MELDLARKIAWSFHRTTGLDFDDLVQEACLAYVMAEQDPNYDPRKSAMTSYAYMSMRWHLCTVTQRMLRTPHSDQEPPEEIDTRPNPEEAAIDTMQYTDEVRFLIKLIFEGPGEYMSLPPKKAFERLTRDLASIYGWPTGKISRAVDQMREVLKQGPVDIAKAGVSLDPVTT